MGKKHGWRRNEEEDEYRRTLLLRARKGDSKAKAELMEKFGMRVYSDTERTCQPITTQGERVPRRLAHLPPSANQSLRIARHPNAR
jgi:hypothetical protein